jgi:hypothetical protein
MLPKTKRVLKRKHKKLKRHRPPPRVGRERENQK